MPTRSKEQNSVVEAASLPGKTPPVKPPLPPPAGSARLRFSINPKGGSYARKRRPRRPERLSEKGERSRIVDWIGQVRTGRPRSEDERPHRWLERSHQRRCHRR